MDTRHPTILRPERSIVLVIDCQTKLWKVIEGKTALEKQIPALIEGARLLDVPVVVTEQYSKGLGATTARIKRAAKGAPVIEKMNFSCFGEPAFVETIRDLDRDTLVITGVETHVCVLQTALDALALGYDVHVVEDGVGTRSELNHEVGLRRLSEAGAILTSVESVLFEWMERCDTDVFKSVQELIK